jgi:hypothetical protein
MLNWHQNSLMLSLSASHSLMSLENVHYRLLNLATDPFTGGKAQSGCDTDHSPPFSAMVKNE